MALVGERTRQTPHFSFLRKRVDALLPPGGSLADRIVTELNRRGHLGAVTPHALHGPVTAGVSDEELLVLLLTPDAPAEGRHWKLVVRAVQRQLTDVARLAWLARLERADVMLAWLMHGVPKSERTAQVERLTELLAPRGAPPKIDYSFARLERQPARREHGWRRPLS